MFKREDIKAGYLLRCTHLKEGRQFNMTVIPCRRTAPPLFWLGDMAKTMDGDLACCNKGMDWLPLSAFDSNLTHAGTYRVDEVWGCAAPMRLMDNTTDGRERLWKRDDTKRMTLEEIEKALGYKVKVVKAGDVMPERDLFKKSSMYAGMVAELRNGSRRLVVASDEGLLLASAPTSNPVSVICYNRLSEYVDGLTTSKYSPNATDVMKLWDRIPGSRYVADAFTTNIANRKLIWERDETKRMTLEEIGKALGYKVEVVATVKS